MCKWNFRSGILALALVLVTLPVVAQARMNGLGVQAELEAVDQYLRSEMEALKIPGLEAVIVYRDQVIYAQGLGVADPSGRPVTAQTPMILGSVSKGFTALAVMQLVEAGRIDLDATIQTVLPWFQMAESPDLNSANAWTQITLRQLLNHTSGIPNFAGENSWSSSYAGEDALENQIRSLTGFHLAHTPGDIFEYSNANYQILGMIVQAVSGQSFESYVQAHIFKPLDMGHSYALVSQVPDLATGYRFWFGLPFAAAGISTPRPNGPSAFIISNAEDMGHYLIAQMNAGQYGDVQILSPSGIAEMHRGSVDSGRGFEYAMGWVVEPDGSLAHTGETPSFTSGIRIEGDWGVFVVRNIAANQREQRLDEIAPGIIDILQGQNPVQNTLDPSFRRTMVALAVLFFLQAVGFAWSLRRLRMWNLHPEKRSRKTTSTLLGTLLILILDLALAAVLWYLGPISNHRLFSVLFQSAPDELLLLGGNVLLALASASIQALSLFRFQKMAVQPNRINFQSG